jgi:hypothetical protein
MKNHMNCIFSMKKLDGFCMKAVNPVSVPKKRLVGAF